MKSRLQPERHTVRYCGHQPRTRFGFRWGTNGFAVVTQNHPAFDGHAAVTKHKESDSWGKRPKLTVVTSCMGIRVSANEMMCKR